MRTLSFRAIFIAAVLFGAFAPLPHALGAASDRYPQSSNFSQTTETPYQAVGNLSFSAWESASVTDTSTFTGSLLDSHSGPIDETALQPDPSKSSRPDKGPGAKVPEPGTLFLACAGLFGLARLSGKSKVRDEIAE